MFIYLPVLLPILVGIYLVKKYPNKVNIVEVLISAGLVFLFVLFSKYISEGAITRDTEYWGGWITRVNYFEPWDERVPCRHPIPCSHPRYDSKGHFVGFAHFNDGHFHLYDVDYHPAEWEALGSNGEQYNISKNSYSSFVRVFNNEKFIELNRIYHSIDGNEYSSYWKGEDSTIQIITSIHNYENRVAVSDSIYKYREVSGKDLFQYPELHGFNIPAVLSKAGPIRGGEAIDFINGKLGAKKKIRVWVLVWKNQPRNVAFNQEAYWRGSNKNELVICLSIDSENNVQWAHVFSWSKSEALKTAINSYLVVDNSKLDLVKFGAWLYPEIEKSWNKRNWHDFDYLSISLPSWMFWFIWIVSCMLTGILAYVAVNNDFD